jgi:hypothetical protein
MWEADIRGGHASGSVQAKNIVRSHLNRKKLGIVIPIVFPGMVGSLIAVKTGLGKK